MNRLAESKVVDDLTYEEWLARVSDWLFHYTMLSLNKWKIDAKWLRGIWLARIPPQEMAETWLKAGGE